MTCTTFYQPAADSTAGNGCQSPRCRLVSLCVKSQRSAPPLTPLPHPTPTPIPSPSTPLLLTFPFPKNIVSMAAYHEQVWCTLPEKGNETQTSFSCNRRIEELNGVESSNAGTPLFLSFLLLPFVPFFFCKYPPILNYSFEF